MVAAGTVPHSLLLLFCFNTDPVMEMCNTMGILNPQVFNQSGRKEDTGNSGVWRRSQTDRQKRCFEYICVSLGLFLELPMCRTDQNQQRKTFED